MLWSIGAVIVSLSILVGYATKLFDLLLDKFRLAEWMRGSWPLTDAAAGGFHRLALQGHCEGGVHHQLGKSLGRFIERFCCRAKELEIVAVFQNRELIAEKTDLGALVVGELFP